MADDFTSDEDKYANESFENESDNEIPEISTSDNESDDLDRDFKRKQEMYASYNRFTNHNSLSKQYTKYASSTEDDDEDDVVISETIAEINTEPMVMDDACTARSFNTRPAYNTVRRFNDHTSGNEDDAEENEDGAEENEDGAEENEDGAEENEDGTEENEDGAEDNEDNVDEEEEIAMTDEEDEEEASEPEIKTSQQKDYKYSNDRQLYESETENEYEQMPDPVSSFENDNNPEEQMLESIQEEKKPEQEEQEEPMDVLTLGDPIEEIQPPRIIRYRYVSTNDNDYVMHKSASIERDFANYRYANAEEVYSVTELETETEGEAKDPQYEFRISSQTPTSFNSNDYAFHMNFMHKAASTEKIRMKSTQRKSWSFTNDRMREIERENQILLKKILTQKPTYTLNPQKSKSNTNCNISAPSSFTRLSSAAINRKKQQRQIDLDNQVLKRKIEAIALRRPVL